MDIPKFFWFATTDFYDPLSIDPLRGVIKKGGAGSQPFVAVDVEDGLRLIKTCQDLHSIHPTIKYRIYCMHYDEAEPLLGKEIG